MKAIAMDMWPAFINAAGKDQPGADVVFDQFHVSKHMGEAVDEVHRMEHKELLQ
jgi:transposase